MDADPLTRALQLLEEVLWYEQLGKHGPLKHKIMEFLAAQAQSEQASKAVIDAAMRKILEGK